MHILFYKYLIYAYLFFLFLNVTLSGAELTLPKLIFLELDKSSPHHELSDLAFFHFGYPKAAYLLKSKLPIEAVRSSLRLT